MIGLCSRARVQGNTAVWWSWRIRLTDNASFWSGEADVKRAEEWEYKYLKTFRLGVWGRLGEHFTDTIGCRIWWILPQSMVFH